MRVTLYTFLCLATLFSALVGAGTVLENRLSDGLQLFSRNTFDEGKSSTASIRREYL